MLKLKRAFERKDSKNFSVETVVFYEEKNEFCVCLKNTAFDHNLIGIENEKLNDEKQYFTLWMSNMWVFISKRYHTVELHMDSRIYLLPEKVQGLSPKDKAWIQGRIEKSVRRKFRKTKQEKELLKYLLEKRRMKNGMDISSCALL